MQVHEHTLNMTDSDHFESLTQQQQSFMKTLKCQKQMKMIIHLLHKTMGEKYSAISLVA